MDSSAMGKIGAHSSWANTKDRSARTSPARAAMMAKFEAQVDPDGTLDPDERAARAAEAKSAYYSALASRPRKHRTSVHKMSAEDHARAADDIRIQASAERLAMYQFLLDRLDEEEPVSEDRRRDELAAIRSLAIRLRDDRADDYLRYLLVPYRDYPECRVEWLV